MTNPIFNIENPVTRIMRESHELDVSCYAECFLAQSLEKRRQAAIETSECYLKRLVEDGVNQPCSKFMNYENLGH